MATERSVSERPVSRGDRYALLFFMLCGAVIAVGAVVQAVMRITDLAQNRDVSVLARFVGTDAEAPIGPAGSSAPVTLETAWVTVPSLPTEAQGAAIIERVVFALTVVTIVVCLLLLGRSVLRGTIFSRGNIGLVVTGGIVALVGFGVAPALAGAAASSALLDFSGGDFTGVALFQADLFPFIIGAFAFATVASAFTIGARLQKETEGLI